MTGLPFSVLLVTVSAQSLSQGTPPLPVHILSVDRQRALDEFDATCLKPMFDFTATQRAVTASSIRYIASDQFTGTEFQQQRWTAPEAILTLSVPNRALPALVNMPQCELVMTASEPHAAKDTLRQIAARLEREYLGPFTFTKDGYALTWPSAQPDTTYRLELMSKTGSTHSMNLIIGLFDRKGREILAALQDGRQDLTALPDCSVPGALDEAPCAEANLRNADAGVRAAYDWSFEQAKLAVGMGHPKSDPALADQLSQSQQAWAAYRDLQCEAESYGLAADLRPMRVARCKARMAQARTSELFSLQPIGAPQR